MNDNIWMDAENMVGYLSSEGNPKYNAYFQIADFAGMHLEPGKEIEVTMKVKITRDATT